MAIYKPWTIPTTLEDGSLPQMTPRTLLIPSTGSGASGASGGAEQSRSTDLFAYGLSYLPNGNISAMQWVHSQQATQSYAYTYDALNRVVTATHNTGNYNMAVTNYDKNGNIQGLTRNGYLGSSFGTIDEMSYSYLGNRLTGISETADTSKGFKASTASYVYDINGNMTSDSGKGITGIDYNHLNLPESITINGSSIGYIYSKMELNSRKPPVETPRNTPQRPFILMEI